MNQTIVAMRSVTVLSFLMASSMFAFADDPPVEDLYQRALDKLATKQYQAAITDFTKVLELDNTYTEAYYKRGNAYFLSKRFTGGIE